MGKKIEHLKNSLQKLVNNTEATFEGEYLKASLLLELTVADQFQSSNYIEQAKEYCVSCAKLNSEALYGKIGNLRNVTKSTSLLSEAKKMDNFRKLIVGIVSEKCLASLIGSVSHQLFLMCSAFRSQW